MRASNGEPPSTDSTPAAVSVPVAWASAWSSSDSASRADPPAARAIGVSASGSNSTPSRSSSDAEQAGDLLDREQRELEVLGARPDRRQHLLRVRGREHEHDVTGRLLERLQQRVRRRVAEHVHLVDQVHLDLRGRADAEADPLDEVADRVDAVVRRGVHLDEVVERPPGDRDAVLARAAGLAVGAEVEAVERLGQDAAGRRLARAARPGEEVRVADAALAHRVAQRGGDVLLADELVEALRSVLAVQGLKRHRSTLASRHPSPGRRSDPSPFLRQMSRTRRPERRKFAGTTRSRAGRSDPEKQQADRAPAVDPTPTGAPPAAGSDQATLRHTGGPAESCFLPDLTRFTRSRCAGPDHLHHWRVAFPTAARASNGNSAPHDVDLGYRAPRAPRLARSAGAG